MIAVATAKKIITDHLITLPVVQTALHAGLQCRLAEDIHSPVDVPAYLQSSMDGYAFAYADWQQQKKLIVNGEMQAGAREAFSLRAGEAARIFTGAPLPANADTVIMQEKVTIQHNELVINDAGILPGNSVRTKGSAIAAGATALYKNTLLTPGAIGFLAGMGITHVPVFAKPRVSIIVTGNELQQPGIALGYGEVYESNSFALMAALQQLQINNVQVYSASDELATVQEVLSKALSHSDMVLLTGGVSVGDYDFVVQAATACGVSQLFHKIKQRPGKPLYVGKKDNQLVLGLPGNPSSVLTCFYEYVLTALQCGLPVLHVPLASALEKSAGLTHFLKGFYNGHTVKPLDAQESYRMSSFATANCLIQLNEETTVCRAGEIAEIHLLSY